MENTKSVSIRIPVKLLEEFKYVAKYEDRSLNSQVLSLMRKSVEEFKVRHGELSID